MLTYLRDTWLPNLCFFVLALLLFKPEWRPRVLKFFERVRRSRTLMPSPRVFARTGSLAATLGALTMTGTGVTGVGLVAEASDTMSASGTLSSPAEPQPRNHQGYVMGGPLLASIRSLGTDSIPPRVVPDLAYPQNAPKSLTLR